MTRYALFAGLALTCAPAWANLISQVLDDNPKSFWILNEVSTAAIDSNVNAFNGTYGSGVTGLTLPPNQWQYVGVVDARNDANFYVNGSFMESVAGTLPTTAPTGDFTMGTIWAIVATLLVARLNVTARLGFTVPSGNLVARQNLRF
jgi:hypothetical protein